MPSVLKGNFVPEKKVVVEAESDDLEARFEREALKRLGGSVAYVSRKRVTWDAPAADVTTDTGEGDGE